MTKTRSNKTGIKGRGKFLKGWAEEQPSTKQRTVMLHNCGKKCFLGPNKSFPICTKNTCKINKKGVHAAYSRARQWYSIRGTRKYKNIATKAYKLLYKKK
jgi:hypothetical protein